MEMVKTGDFRCRQANFVAGRYANFWAISSSSKENAIG